jgi:MFS family permease
MTSAAAQTNTAYRWLVLAAATFAQATSSFAMLGGAALAGFLQRDFRLSGTETGLLITATYGAAVFSLLFVGDLLDRKSERIIIGVGGAIAFIALMMATSSGNFAALLLCLFVAGLGFSVTQPGGSKSVSAWFRGDRLGLAMGIRQAGLPLGGALAAAILPAVAAASSWRAAFAAGAVATLGGAFVFALVYRPPAEDAGAASKRAALSYAAVAGLLRQSWMRNAMIAGLALVSAQYAILTWLMLYLRDHAHRAHARSLVSGTGAGRRRRRPRRSCCLERPLAGAALSPVVALHDRGGRRLCRFVAGAAANAGAGARTPCRLARLLRARLVRTVSRLFGGYLAPRQGRIDARRRYGDQSTRHHRRTAAPWPRARSDRRLCRTVGLRDRCAGRCLCADRGEAQDVDGRFSHLEVEKYDYQTGRFLPRPAHLKSLRESLIGPIRSRFGAVSCRLSADFVAEVV